MIKIIQKSFFVLLRRHLPYCLSFIRRLWFFFQGMRVGRGTVIPRMVVTWPHQVSVGNNCHLENDIFFKFDGIWKPGPSIILSNNVFVGRGCEFNIREKIFVGNNSLIASGCKFIDHDHGIGTHDLIRKQAGLEKEICIGENVWLGCNVVVLKGVNINSGAVVAAGAVVTKSIPENEIWGGVPARKIGYRAK